MTDPSDLAAEVRHRLAEVADPEQAPRMQAYMKSPMPFLGVSVQPMRRVLREVFAQCRLPDRDAWAAGCWTFGTPPASGRSGTPRSS